MTAATAVRSTANDDSSITSMNQFLARAGALFLPCVASILAADERPLPPALAPHFSPPAQFAGNLGEFHSPLKFDDGSSARTAADWPRRRAEILKYWEGQMGAWPSLLPKESSRY
jgi:hypothetical protein